MPEFKLLWASYREAEYRLGPSHPFVKTWRTAVRAALRPLKAQRVYPPMFR